MAEVDLFLVVLGFALAKMAIGATIIWLGIRTPEGPGSDDFDGGTPPPEPSPWRPRRRSARVGHVREGRPSRRPRPRVGA